MGIDSAALSGAPLDNFAALLRARFAQCAEQPCFLNDDGDWSYRQLTERVDRLAGLLVSLGVEPGDRVLAQVQKSPEAIALYLAVLQAGAIYAPLNTAYTEAEIAYFLDDAEPKLLVHDPEATLPPVRCRCLSLRGATGSLVQAEARATPLERPVTRLADDVALLVYTSGTTGRAKGAMLTHANLRANADALFTAWGWRDEDVLLHALPIFHVHGLLISLHCAFLGGTPTWLLPRFDPDAIKRVLPQCTVMMGVPTYYTRLLNDPDFDATLCRSMRLFISGSAPLVEPVFHAWEKRTGHRILERYGMSETIINTSNPLHGERQAGTVGFPLPGVRLRVADERGAALPPGQVGGIEVRGDNVFAGYWRKPEQTQDAFRPDGYFITGDLGELDATGRLSIVGRSTDLVISGGYNVYPREVESLIDQVVGVIESAVIGVPHPDFGEAVVAVVAAKPAFDPDQVQAALAGRLARFKHPKQMLLVRSLPRNSMGKVQKAQLRRQYADLFT